MFFLLWKTRSIFFITTLFATQKIWEQLCNQVTNHIFDHFLVLAFILIPTLYWLNAGERHLPTAEAEAGAGKVLVWEERVARHLLIWNIPAEAFTQGLEEGTRRRQTNKFTFRNSGWFHKEYKSIRRFYLESLVDDAGWTRRAGGVVVQLLLQASQQTTEVRGRVVGSSSSVLNGTKCFWEQTQFPEALLKKTLCWFRCFVWDSKRKWSIFDSSYWHNTTLWKLNT